VSGFIKPNIYEFHAEGTDRYDTHVTFKAEFTSYANGEASVKFWAETLEYEHWNSKNELVPEKREIVRGVVVTTNDLVRDDEGKYTDDLCDWLLRSHIIALARGADAPNLVWDVFWQTQIKTASAWLEKAAPNWWRQTRPEVKT